MTDDLVYSTHPQLFMKAQTQGQPGGLPPAGQEVRLRREKQGRAGKTVTALFGFQASERQCEELGKALRRALGTGCTAKNGRVELQGDCLAKAQAALQAMGYQPKQAGG